MKFLYDSLNEFFTRFKPLNSFHYNVLSKVDGSNSIDYPAMILESPTTLTDKPGCHEIRCNVDFQDLLRNSSRSYSKPDPELQASLQSYAQTLVEYLTNVSNLYIPSWSLMFYTNYSDNICECCRLSMSIQVPKVEPCVDLTDTDLWYQGGTDIRPEKDSIIPNSWS